MESATEIRGLFNKASCSRMGTEASTFLASFFRIREDNFIAILRYLYMSGLYTKKSRSINAVVSQFPFSITSSLRFTTIRLYFSSLNCEYSSTAIPASLIFSPSSIYRLCVGRIKKLQTLVSFSLFSDCNTRYASSSKYRFSFRRILFILLSVTKRVTTPLNHHYPSIEKSLQTLGNPCV